MRVLFDSNVLYSAFTAMGFCEEVVDESVGECVFVWSDSLRTELVDLLKRKYKLGVGTLSVLTAFADLCEFHEPEPLPAAVCRDPDDDVVLATAVAAKADMIVTGDADLLIIKKYKRIRILSPRQFLELLDTAT